LSLLFSNLMSTSSVISIPEKRGMRWTKDEETMLLTELKDRKSILDIAQIHKRTEKGILSRLKQIACQLLDDEHSIDSVIEITQLSKKEIENSHKRRLRKDKKSNNNHLLNIYSILSRIEVRLDKIEKQLESLELV
jgi:hypothetical protein